MTNSTLPSILPFLIIITIFLLFILVYLRITSEYFGKKRFQNSLIGLMVIAGLLAIGSFVFRKGATKYKRISALPFITPGQAKAPELVWAKAEQINASIDENLPDEFLVYPIAWTMEAINFDSLGYKDYLEEYAQRIKLDYVIILSSNGKVQFSSFEKASLVNLVTKEIAEPDNLVKTVTSFVVDYLLSKRPTNQKISQPLNYTVLAAQTSLSLVENNYEQAINYAETAFQLDTTLVNARNLLADTQLKAAVNLDHEGKPSGINKLIALRLCEGTLVRYDSLNAKTHQLLGRYYLLEEMWQKAEQHLTKAFQLDPTIPQVFFDFSHLHDSRAKNFGYGNKEKLLKHAFAIDPCYAKARLNLADYLYFNKWVTQSKNEINELLKINPTFIDAWLYLGKIAIAESDIDKIIPIYNRILEIDPKNKEAYYNLGVFYFNNKDVENAADFFQRAILYGDHLESHLYMGHIYESRGEIDKAIAEYRYRIKYKRGFDDPYADQARQRLYNLTDADSALDKYYGRDKK